MHRAALFVLVLLLVAPAAADEIGLIRVGEVWKFQKGLVPPPTNWAAADFDDRFWPESMTGFSTSGGFGEATIFTDYGSAYSSIYFRKAFDSGSPATIKELVLRLDYDDGCVIHLNGREIARRGIAGAPDSPVANNALSSPHARGQTELIDLSSGLPFLRSGRNVLAVHLLGSSTYDWSMSFVPELLANFTRTPYVQNNTLNSIQIAWQTLSRTDGLVQYGTNLTDTVTANATFGQTNHLATLRGLLADTTYHYRVGLRFPHGETWSDWRQFRTFKPAGPVTFTITGDTGWGSIQQYQVARQLQRTEADLLMHLGDLTYAAITERNSDLRLLSVYAEQMRSIPMFVAWGNHDAVIDLSVALNVFHLPTNQVTGTEHYYSFDHGDVHFVALWTDLLKSSAYHPGSPQYEWLDRDLAASNKPWKFLFFHHCWRTSSYHIIDDYDANGINDMVQLDVLGELASRHGVQAIFHAHDHCYERFAPRRGIVSFTSGGGGASLYAMSSLHPDSVEYQPRFHLMKVAVAGDVATVQAIDELGRLFDTYHIPRGTPSNELHHASWHRPQIEDTPGDDGDGNIAGQSFDFAGRPIMPSVGRSTSAGRLFVNNDSETLYLGLDEVLLRAGEEVFLFLGGPGETTSSSTDLRPFGWDLRFENFAPQCVAILGDEFADLNPANQIFAQGLRRLQPGLPPVAGQRLQQFNRSPQRGAAFYEQAANFIELAVPLSSLGLAPGDPIRVAAVVGHRPAPGSPRPFDSGGVIRPGQSAPQPVEVQLASSPPEDRDGDSAPDTAELLAGTDPANPASNLSLKAERIAGGHLRLSWAATPGRWYRLEASANLAAGFRDLDPSFPRRAAAASEHFTVPAGIAGNRPPIEYYRVVLVSE